MGTDETGLPINQYIFSPIEIENQSPYPIRKLKMVLTTGVHGYEQGAAWNVANFFQDLCENNQVDKQLEFMNNNVEFLIIPVVNPYGYNNNQRTNSNFVDINRNFDSNWKESVSKNLPNGYYSGEFPESELSTQIVSDVLRENADAEYFIDCHNISIGYPLFYLFDRESSTIANSLFTTLTRKWKKDYPQAPQGVEVFGYVKGRINSCASDYAISIGHKSLIIEMPWKIPFSDKRYDKITTETGIETFGNLLLTMFKSIK